MSLFQPEPDEIAVISQRSWKVAIIDDDAEVHSVTRLVLSGVLVDQLPLQFFSAYSASEGLRLFSENHDIAVALIDVVMEEDDAGLQLVEKIRNRLGNHRCRIILRTGQPGRAPEDRVIRDYDINDYKNKTELTAQRLKTSVYAALRSYRDILTIDESLKAMEKVLSSTSSVLRSRTLPHFGSAVLEQSLTLLNLEHSALYLVTQVEDLYSDVQLKVLAATGDFTQCSNSSAADIPEPVRELLDLALRERCSLTTDAAHVTYYETSADSISLLYIAHDRPLTALQQRMLELFASSATLMFENLTSREDVQQTQKELILVISEAIEARSKETGAHVRRVARMCAVLATAAGCDERFIDTLRHAAPLHDVGKIAIPEAILHKPGKLDAAEWAIMQSHAQLGHDLLVSSNRVIAKMGARIALCHHERWDGTGYPQQLVAEAIPLEARIMALADVIDALSARRCYKQPWDDEAIVAYLKEQSGKQFDPQLTQLALANYAEFIAIRKELPDQP